MPDDLGLHFRPVRPEDKPRVLAFTANTWGDGDYIKDVFDDWLVDPRGRFIAAELDGEAVAIARLSDLGEGELWLEGIRVDPAHRRKGIGEALHRYNVDLARRYGGDVLRYATGEDNAASRRFGERTGFKHVANYWWHDAGPSTEFRPPERLTRDDWPALTTRFHSPLVHAPQKLYQHYWRWRVLSEARLETHLQAGEVFGLRREGSGLRAWSICSPDEDGEMWLQHLDAIDAGSLTEMARAVRRLAAELSCKTIVTFALEPSPLIGALREAGYRTEQFTLIVLELRWR